MRTRGSLTSALTAVILLAASSLLLAQRTQALRGEQKLQMEVLRTLVDEVAAQKHSGPADVALTWQNHFLKAAGGLVYVPYTVGIDGKFDELPVAMYVRVLIEDAQQKYYDASKSSTIRTWLNVASSPTQIDSKDIRSGNVEGTSPTAEDIYFFEPPKDGRLRRALWLPPGNYEVFVAMRERPVGKGLPKITLLKQPLTVPDLSKDLAISSLILAEAVEPASGALNQKQQLTQPYSIGGTRITPAATTRFKRGAELLFVFFIYNPGAAANGKPDVQADYTFLRQAGDVDRLFNALPPQQFNAQNLPPEFDLAAGHLLMGGQSVPLDTFPEGQYRLQVKVTDNTSGASTMSDVVFSVQ